MGGIAQVRLSNEPYLFINIFLAAVIAVVFVYSAVFSPSKNDYPVVCVHEKLTGQPCASCGLSHSFSYIMRGEFSEAFKWNAYGMRVFIFFVSQIIIRVMFSVLYLRNPGTRKNLIITDSVGSGIMFIITFWPFMRWMVTVLLQGH
jgi:hypothetical protein